VGYVDQGPMNFITAHIYRQGESDGDTAENLCLIKKHVLSCI